MYDYFKKFGEIEQITIMKDKYSSKSRCFGFIIFTDESALKHVIEKKSSLVLKEKLIDVKLAIPKKILSSTVDPQVKGRIKSLFSTSYQSKKIFLGGLAATVDESKFIY